VVLVRCRRLQDLLVFQSTTKSTRKKSQEPILVFYAESDSANNSYQRKGPLVPGTRIQCLHGKVYLTNPSDPIGQHVESSLQFCSKALNDDLPLKFDDK